MIAMTMSPLHVSVASFFLLLMGFLFVLIKMPETLTEDAAADAAAREQQNSTGGIKSLIFRPVSELSILNRDQLFRTLGALAFFSGLAANGDQSLLIYYVESHLGFQAADVAKLFIILGLSGIFVNSIVLKLLTNLMGERLVIVLSFAVGVIHNIFYGIATSKGMVYGACCLGTITMLSFPVISAIKSNNVKASEQGRIQGALYSVKSLSAALGPVTLRYVSENSGFLGPGFMFIFCSFLYLIATVWAFLLPKDRSNSSAKFGGGVVEGKDPKQAPHLQEPLMGA
jgi:DHA1 family tetracycline resistance protein-like MFS transporter